MGDETGKKGGLISYSRRSAVCSGSGIISSQLRQWNDQQSVPGVECRISIGEELTAGHYFNCALWLKKVADPHLITIKTVSTTLPRIPSIMAI